MSIGLSLSIVLFLYLGGLLYLYAGQQGVTETGDKLFPAIALQHMPPIVSVIFIIALISALFPSADGAITALTSTFCIDILGIQRNQDLDDAGKKESVSGCTWVLRRFFWSLSWYSKSSTVRA